MHNSQMTLNRTTQSVVFKTRIFQTKVNSNLSHSIPNFSIELVSLALVWILLGEMACVDFSGNCPPLRALRLGQLHQYDLHRARLHLEETAEDPAARHLSTQVLGPIWHE